MQTTLFPVYGMQQVCDDCYMTAPVRRKFSFFIAPLTNPVPSMELNVQEFFNIISGKAFFMNDVPLNHLAQRTFRHWQRYQHLREQYSEAKCSFDDLGLFKKYSLDYVTIAGVFNLRRKYDCLTSRSAYAMLNLNELADVDDMFIRLQNDMVLKPVMLYRSLNNGIVAIVDIASYEQSYFSVVRELNTYLAKAYHQKVINPRVTQYTCPAFVTYDPKAWLAPDFYSLPK